MNGWFLTEIIISCMGLGMNLVKHGEPKDGEYSFWAYLLSGAIHMFIIYMAIKTGF